MAPPTAISGPASKSTNKGHAGPKITTTASAPLTPQLRSDINAALIAGGHVEKIQSQLLASLQASGWQENVRALCLEMLRAGEARSQTALMRRVREDVRAGDGRAKVADSVIDDGIAVVREALAAVVVVEDIA
ncbi:MAG: hypothetical protein M1825_003469 [Sarcosagium campestre]|nr:MAG: hypothetical protein M1825_003469 [Sarcosagium campestre]